MRRLCGGCKSKTSMYMARKIVKLFSNCREVRKDDTRVTELLGVPMILVMDTHSATCSITPLVCNFGRFGPTIGVTNVIFGRISSPSRFTCLHRTYISTKIRYLKCLPVARKLGVPSQRLNLALATGHSVGALVRRTTRLIKGCISLSGLLDVYRHGFPYQCALPCDSRAKIRDFAPSTGGVGVTVTQSPTFGFVCERGVSHLSTLKDVACFDPMCNDSLPSTSLICLPKKCPRLFTHRLRQHGGLVRTLEACTRRKKGVLTRYKNVVFLAHSLATHRKKATCTVAKVLPLSYAVINTELRLKCHHVRCGKVRLHKRRFRCSGIITPSTVPSMTGRFATEKVRIDAPLCECGGIVTKCARLC